MSTDRIYLITGDVPDGGIDESALAAAVIGQCFQDVNYFLRIMRRKGIHSIHCKAHRQMTTDNHDYREAFHDCAGAIRFLAHPTRHEDRLIWCEYLELKPTLLVEYVIAKYADLEREINHDIYDFSIDMPSTNTVWNNHSLGRNTSLPGKKLKRGRRRYKDATQYVG